MKLEYDPIGDILYLESLPPYAAQCTREVAEGVLTRSNPKSGRVESTEVQSFVHRSTAGMLPLDVPKPGSSSQIVVDYDADSRSVVLKDAEDPSRVVRTLRLDTLSGEYAAETAALRARARRATA